MQPRRPRGLQPDPVQASWIPQGNTAAKGLADGVALSSEKIQGFPRGNPGGRAIPLENDFGSLYRHDNEF